ncbi:MAG: 2TM domain-containing protein, partial [Actinobacteria bacterium]|nr:2TM domain-containing protein [Actinomycetota bacterium]
MDDTERREAAIKRLRDKRDFWTHVVVYLLVNGLLIVVWYVSNPDAHFWPVWVLAGWGIGLVMHAWETFKPAITE